MILGSQVRFVSTHPLNLHLHHRPLTVHPQAGRVLHGGILLVLRRPQVVEKSLYCHHHAHLTLVRETKSANLAKYAQIRYSPNTMKIDAGTQLIKHL